MFPIPENSEVLLQAATNQNLYEKLIIQINKDFSLANETIDFHSSTKPLELVVQLEEKMYRMLQFKFAEYLNLLYIIDVSEEEVKKLDGSNLSELAKQMAFLILKREWMKVWYRNKY